MADKKTIREEKALVSACIQGNKAAGDELVERYSKLVYWSIYRTLQAKGWSKEPDLANDLHQEFFSRLLEDNFKRLKQFDWIDNSSLATWIYKVARNLTFDFIRKESRIAEKTKPLSETSDSDKEKNNEDWKDIIKSALKNLTDEERKLLLNKALETLDEEERTLIRSLFYQDKSYQLVAKTMGRSVDALYMQKKRTLEKLQDFFKKHVGSEELRRLL